MKITKQKLIELDACEDNLARFIEQTGNTEEPVDVATLLGGLNNYSDLLWLAGESLTRERIVKFACDCALINIQLIKPYTDKYDEIVQFLKEPCAARDATYAADRAARDTYYTAYAAAAYAAYAAAYAAYAYVADTDAAATAYAAYVADAARDSEAVNSLLIEMFNEVE